MRAHAQKGLHVGNPPSILPSCTPPTLLTHSPALRSREAMEDAVTFLESAKAVYADVALLLNKTQLLALDKDPNEPFSDQVIPV